MLPAFTRIISNSAFGTLLDGLTVNPKIFHIRGLREMLDMNSSLLFLLHSITGHQYFFLTKNRVDMFHFGTNSCAFIRTTTRLYLNKAQAQVSL